MKPSDTIMVSAAFIEEHNKLKEENERLQWYDRIRTEDMIKLEKKLAITIDALKNYADRYWYNRYALDEDDEMPELAKETLKRIEEVTNE